MGRETLTSPDSQNPTLMTGFTESGSDGGNCVGKATHSPFRATDFGRSTSPAQSLSRWARACAGSSRKDSKMATDIHDDAEAPVVRDEIVTRDPIAGSRKVYVAGTLHEDVRVPIREIQQSPTRSHLPGGQDEPNPAITVYDTSGPYTDPDVAIDVRRGLPPLRLKWIRERGDVEELASLTSKYGQ